MGSPIFAVHGTQLDAVHARWRAAAQGLYSSSATPISVAASADTGVFGASMIQKANTTGVRALVYPGWNNWTENPAFTILMRIIPRFNGHVAAVQFLCSTIAGDGTVRSGLQFYLDAAGKLNCILVDKYGSAIGSTATGAVATSFTSGTAVDISVSFDGTTIKFAINGVVTDTFTGYSVTTRDNTNVATLLFGAQVADSAAEANYDINEIVITNTADDMTAFAGRVAFIPTTAFDGSANVDPGIANVNYLQSYMIAGVALVGTKRDTSPADAKVQFGTMWYADSVLHNGALITLNPSIQRYLPNEPVTFVQGESVQFLIPILAKSDSSPVDLSAMAEITCQLLNDDGSTLALTLTGSEVFVNQGQLNEAVVNLSATASAGLALADPTKSQVKANIEVITVDAAGNKVIYPYPAALIIQAPLFS